MDSIRLPTIAFPQVLKQILPRPLAKTLNFLLDLSVSLSLLCIGRGLPSIRWKLPRSSSHLSGRVAIVTGSNSGIGLQIAKDLTHLGATVILACRNVQKAEEARQEIIAGDYKAKDRVTVMQLDTSSMKSVRQFCETWRISNEGSSDKIDILVHNAGIAGAPASAISPYSEDGFELTYATNVLGSFLLTYLLESCLSDDARVVFTSSTGQYSGKINKAFSLTSVKHTIEPGFHSVKIGVTGAEDVSSSSSRYGQTKCMQVAFARLLQQRFEREAKNEGIRGCKIAHSFTPGFTSTPIFGKFESTGFKKDVMFDILKTTTSFATNVSEGAATGSWLASTNDEEVTGIGNGGRHFDRCVARMSSVDLLEQETLDRLWIRWQADAGVEWL